MVWLLYCCLFGCLGFDFVDSVLMCSVTDLLCLWVLIGWVLPLWVWLNMDNAWFGFLVLNFELWVLALCGLGLCSWFGVGALGCLFPGFVCYFGLGITFCCVRLMMGSGFRNFLRC